MSRRYIGNVASNPGEEKFRRIRVSNAAFQSKVASVPHSLEFLELVGFKVSSVSYERPHAPSPRIRAILGDPAQSLHGDCIVGTLSTLPHGSHLCSCLSAQQRQVAWTARPRDAVLSRPTHPVSSWTLRILSQPS